MKERLTSLAKKAHQAAKKLGIDKYRFSISISSSQKLDVHDAKIDRIISANDSSFSFTTFKDDRETNISGTGVDSLEKIITQADALSKYSQKNEYNSIPEKSEMVREIEDFDTYHSDQITLAQAAEFALSLEKATRMTPKIHNTEDCFVSIDTAHSLFSNNHEVDCYDRSTSYAACITAIAGKGDDSQIGNHWQQDSKFSSRFDIEKISETATGLATGYLNPRKIPTKKYDIIFNPETAGVLWASLLSAISGFHIYQKSSFLIDKLGDKIFPDFINISENPHILYSMYSQNFDDDGVQTFKKSIITNGILDTYLLDTYYAKKLNKRSTANAGGTSNILVKAPHTISSDELIAQQKEAILITELTGGGIDILNGNFSKGAKGFYIKNGEIQHSVSNITLAGHLLEIYSQISQVSTDYDDRFSIRTGSVLVNNMSVSSES